MLGSNGKIPESTDLFRHTEVKMEQVSTAPEMLDQDMAYKYKAKMKRVLPYLALNEVCFTPGIICHQLLSTGFHL